MKFKLNLMIFCLILKPYHFLNDATSPGFGCARIGKTAELLFCPLLIGWEKADVSLWPPGVVKTKKA